MKIRTILVDDEPLAREGLALLLAKDPDFEIVAECEDGFEAVNTIRELAPDLVFLDIDMPGLDGFQVIEKIGSGAMPLIVFLTAYNEFAIEAFRVHALDYLLKPLAEERFLESLQRVKTELARRRLSRHGNWLSALLSDISAIAAPEQDGRKKPERLMVRCAGHVYFIKTDSIKWVEADGDYVSIYTDGKTHLVRITLKAMEEKLAGQGFQRIHRSTLVNLDCIRELVANDSGDYRVILKDDTELKLSRSYRDALYSRLQADA